MAICLQYKKKQHLLEWQLDKRHFFAAIVSVFSIAIIVVYGVFASTNNSDSIHLDSVRLAKQSIQQQSETLQQLKDRTQVEMTAMKLKLGELQAQLVRVNALGARLQESAKLEGNEFAFDQTVATGGPAQQVAVSSLQSGVQHELLDNMDILLVQFNEQERQLSALESVMMNHNISNESYVSGRPIESGWLSSYYGMRKDPFNGLPAMHKGIDFAGEEGNKVIVTGAGIVVWAGERYGYGNLIEVEHGGGLRTRYGHNQQIVVEVGQVVTKGQQIGVMGSTGRSTGPHVHYEVLKNGKPIDPLKYVYRKAKS